MISSKEAQIASIQTQIQQNADTLKELKEKAEQARRLQEEQAKLNSGGSSFKPSSSGNVVSGNGYFTHPCPGMTYQSSYFGEVRAFDPRPHKGNDYAAPAGTPTYAAAAGTVVIAGWSNSAGNWVVINHGNGLVTKYMHHKCNLRVSRAESRKRTADRICWINGIFEWCTSAFPGRIKWNSSKSKYIFVVC